MKKILSTIVVATALVATTADAGSIGRSGGGVSSAGRSSSFSSSVSRPTYTYTAPSASSTSRSGGIGGTAGSIGVRKSEVTNSVRSDIAQTKPISSSAYSGSTGPSSSYTPHYAPVPSYGHVATPQPTVTNGSTFLSSMGGSFLGSALGNMMFSNHGHAGTTVINNGATPAVSTGGPFTTNTVSGPSQGMSTIDGSVATIMPAKQPYTIWSFIGDVIGFGVLLFALAGIAWLLYKGFQMVRNFINKERGVSTTPFNATKRFWEIQNAFATADVATLNKLLGPDTVDELTRGISPSEITLRNVSHEVRLQTPTEYSVWYKFTDADEEVNQVWHYERFGSEWKLNGIENV